MTVLSSALDPASGAYAERRTAMLAKIADLDAEHAEAGGRVETGAVLAVITEK